MNAASVQCPLCFTRSPAPAAGAEVVCPGCNHAFTPSAVGPPPRKNPDVPYARVLSGGATAPKVEPKPAAPPPARRAREDDEDDRPRPRTRSRRRYDDDDEPVKRGNSALPLVLIAGGVLAVLTLGGVVAVGAVMFATPSVSTRPVAVAGPSWATQADDPITVDPERRGMREMQESRPQPPAPPPPIGNGTRPTDPLKAEQKPAAANGNALVTKHRAKLMATASSQWQSWPVTHLLDGNEKTSWYSNGPDNTSTVNKPWVKLTFPEDVSVTRVTVLGNRDPEYPNGYTVTDGTVELLDANGKVISEHALTGAGEKSDFDLRLTTPTKVRAVRFTMTKSLTGNCGLGEFQVE